MGAGASALADSSSEINTYLKSKEKKNPNNVTSSEWFFNACWFNNVAVAKTLLDRGEPNLRWESDHPSLDGRTCIHVAAYAGNIDIVKLLIEYEPDVINFEDKDGYLPLDYAKINHHSDIVNILKTNRRKKSY